MEELNDKKQISPAEKKALDIFHSHYIILFDSDSDKGEEILVSILAIKASIVTVDEMLMILYKIEANRIDSDYIAKEIDFYTLVRAELLKM